MPDTIQRTQRDTLRHAALIAALRHPAGLLDGTGALLLCNDAFAGWLGLGPCPPEGIARDDWLPGAASATFHAALAAGTAQSVALPLRGTSALLTFSPLPDDAGGAVLCQLDDSGDADAKRLQYLMEHLDHGVWDYDVTEGRFTVSRAWREMRGMSPDFDLGSIVHTRLRLIHPDDRPALAEAFGSQTRGERTSIDLHYRYRHASGHWIWILCRAKVVSWDTHGKPLRIVGTDADITALKQRDEEVAALSNKLSMAIKASGVGVWEFDPDTNSVHWDDRMLTIYGITDGQNHRHGNLWETHLHPDDLAGTVAYSDYCQAHGLDFQRDYRIVRPDGSIRHIRSLAAVVAAREMRGRLVGVNIDITEERERQAQLEAARARMEHDSRHDALTGLANRRLLDERMAALHARATPECHCAVLLLDLDRFKQINDALGHDAGDAVLVRVGKTIQRIVGKDGLACRTGGDEFVILYEQAPSPAALGTLCDRLLTAFDAPFVYQGKDCDFGVSIGCAVGPAHTANPSDIFIRADTALYAAKQAGRGCYRIHPAHPPALSQHP